MVVGLNHLASELSQTLTAMTVRVEDVIFSARKKASPLKQNHFQYYSIE